MSAGIGVEALSVTLGAFQLRGLDFTVSPGEVLVILGPNGSGKSVTLETIAGFHRPANGRVLIGGQDVTALAPERRNIGFVVQNFGLFPHLTVTQNIAIARRPEREGTETDKAISVPRDTAGLLAYVGIVHLAQRQPNDLSPGEKQRVALARALASAPDLFLFDEPFAALDAQTSDQLREELHAFLRQLSVPAIFVTHDHVDAMILADRIAVLREGAIVQYGSAAEIFAKPANAFVAHFVGVENILDARVVDAADTVATLAVGGRNLHAAVPADSVQDGDSVCVAIRGEQVTICLPEPQRSALPAINRLDGRVTSVRYVGPLATVEIDCGFPLRGYLLAPQARAMNIEADRPVTAEIADDAVHVMPNSGRL
jgi:ABC-type Fe3+/spermidine/putrescine transport system ATPase subunit